MKEILLLLLIIMMFVFTGCFSNADIAVNNCRDYDEENEIQKNMEKFLHDGDTYTAELFVKMADTYEGTLAGETQQTYVLDVRSQEEYNKGHIIGAINIEAGSYNIEELIEKIPSDYTVYVIGETDAEAREMALRLKEADEQLFVYIIEGGYGSLAKIKGIDKYIGLEPGAFGNFTRTKAQEWFDSIVSPSTN